MQSRRLATWRTIECYAANPLLPLSVARLCRETGVSPRTLDHACRANTGRSPIAYIRHCHMALAHVMLRRAGTVHQFRRQRPTQSGRTGDDGRLFVEHNQSGHNSRHIAVMAS